MSRHASLVAGCAALLLLSYVGLAFSQAPEPSAAPTYLRQRPGAEQWLERTQGAYGYGWAYPGIPYGFFAPPVVAGSWYARPYPYHFDYYRHRWGGQPEAAMPPDCPCATEPAPSEALPPES
jgi:hypothetical protein